MDDPFDHMAQWLRAKPLSCFHPAGMLQCCATLGSVLPSRMVKAQADDDDGEAALTAMDQHLCMLHLAAEGRLQRRLGAAGRGSGPGHGSQVLWPSEEVTRNIIYGMVMMVAENRCSTFLVAPHLEGKDADSDINGSEGGDDNEVDQDVIVISQTEAAVEEAVNEGAQHGLHHWDNMRRAVCSMVNMLRSALAAGSLRQGDLAMAMGDGFDDPFLAATEYNKFYGVVASAGEFGTEEGGDDNSMVSPRGAYAEALDATSQARVTIATKQASSQCVDAACVLLIGASARRAFGMPAEFAGVAVTCDALTFADEP